MTIGCTASGHSAPTLSTEDEPALDHVRHNGDAFRMIDHLFGDPFIWSCHDFVKHRTCLVETFGGCFAENRAEAQLMPARLITASIVIIFFIIHTFRILPADNEFNCGISLEQGKSYAP